MLQFNELLTLCTNRVHAVSVLEKPFDSLAFRCATLMFSLVVVNMFSGSCASRNPQTLLTPQTNGIAEERTVDINSANVGQLEKLPRIGPKMAAKIIEHRERFGDFRRTEELMMVEGFSESRYMAIRRHVRAD